jgi:uncharacterized membrane protein YeiB
MPPAAGSQGPWRSEMEEQSDARREANAAAMEILTPSYAAIRTHARDTQRCGLLAKANVALLLCAVLLAAYFSLHADRAALLRWLKWARQHPVEGRCVFVAVYSASMVAMVPGSLLALLAGEQARMLMMSVMTLCAHVIAARYRAWWSSTCMHTRLRRENR